MVSLTACPVSLSRLMGDGVACTVSRLMGDGVACTVSRLMGDGVAYTGDISFKNA